MATSRRATTRWEGSLLEGAGRVSLDSSGLGTYEVTWVSRAEDTGGRTSPEELIAAAHSACFSMALSNALASVGQHCRAARNQCRRYVPARRGHHRHPPQRDRSGTGPVG